MIGDTLYDGSRAQLPPMPAFTPELFAGTRPRRVPAKAAPARPRRAGRRRSRAAVPRRTARAAHNRRSGRRAPIRRRRLSPAGRVQRAGNLRGARRRTRPAVAPDIAPVVAGAYGVRILVRVPTEITLQRSIPSSASGARFAITRGCWTTKTTPSSEFTHIDERKTACLHPSRSRSSAGSARSAATAPCSNPAGSCCCSTAV